MRCLTPIRETKRTPMDKGAETMLHWGRDTPIWAGPKVLLMAVYLWSKSVQAFVARSAYDPPNTTSLLNHLWQNESISAVDTSFTIMQIHVSSFQSYIGLAESCFRRLTSPSTKRTAARLRLVSNLSKIALHVPCLASKSRVAKPSWRPVMLTYLMKTHIIEWSKFFCFKSLRL